MNQAPRPPRMAPPLTALGYFAAIWGIVGVCGFLGSALYRLTPMAIEPWTTGTGLTPFQWVLFVGFIIINAHAEGYRGFQKAFSPRVVNRAFHLGAHPKPLHVLLAPIYCMALMHARRKRMIANWILVTVLMGVIILVKQVPQPWRAIIDGGVVVGLGWGTIALLIFFVRGLVTGRLPEKDPDLPDAR